MCDVSSTLTLCYITATKTLATTTLMPGYPLRSVNYSDELTRVTPATLGLSLFAWTLFDSSNAIHVHSEILREHELYLRRTEIVPSDRGGENGAP